MDVFCYKMKLFLLEIMKILAIFYNKGEKIGWERYTFIIIGYLSYNIGLKIGYLFYNIREPGAW